MTSSSFDLQEICVDLYRPPIQKTPSVRKRSHNEKEKATYRCAGRQRTQHDTDGGVYTRVSRFGLHPSTSRATDLHLSRSMENVHRGAKISEAQVTETLHSLLGEVTLHQYQWSQTASVVILITASAMASLSGNTLLSLLARDVRVQSLHLAVTSLFFSLASMISASIPITAYAAGLWNQVSLITLRLRAKRELPNHIARETETSTYVVLWITLLAFPCSILNLSVSMIIVLWTFHEAMTPRQMELFSAAGCGVLTGYISLVTAVVLYVDMAGKFRTVFGGKVLQPSSYLTMSASRLMKLVTAAPSLEDVCTTPIPEVLNASVPVGSSVDYFNVTPPVLDRALVASSVIDTMFCEDNLSTPKW